MEKHTKKFPNGKCVQQGVPRRPDTRPVAAPPQPCKTAQPPAAVAKSRARATASSAPIAKPKASFDSSKELFRVMTLCNGGAGLSETDVLELLTVLHHPNYQAPQYKTVDQYKAFVEQVVLDEQQRVMAEGKWECVKLVVSAADVPTLSDATYTFDFDVEAHIQPDVRA